MDAAQKMIAAHYRQTEKYFSASKNNGDGAMVDIATMPITHAANAAAKMLADADALLRSSGWAGTKSAATVCMMHMPLWQALVARACRGANPALITVETQNMAAAARRVAANRVPKVGDTFTADNAKMLGVGSKIMDNEQDTWTKNIHGNWMEEGGAFSTTDDLLRGSYAPFTITYVAGN